MRHASRTRDQFQSTTWCPFAEWVLILVINDIYYLYPRHILYFHSVLGRSTLQYIHIIALLHVQGIVCNLHITLKYYFFLYFLVHNSHFVNLSSLFSPPLSLSLSLSRLTTLRIIVKSTAFINVFLTYYRRFKVTLRSTIVLCKIYIVHVDASPFLRIKFISIVTC